MALANPIAPFPYLLPPVSNITPFTYPDGLTYLELLERLRVWLRDTVIPGFDANITAALASFQAGVANAEATATAIQAAQDAARTAFEDTVNQALAGYTSDTAATKADWTSQFAAFKADITNQLAGLNDAAVASLTNDTASQLRGALNTAIRTQTKNVAAGTGSARTVTVTQTFEVGTAGTRLAALEVGRMYLIVAPTTDDIQLAVGWPDTTNEPAAGYEAITVGNEALVMGTQPVWVKAAVQTYITVQKGVRP